MDVCTWLQHVDDHQPPESSQSVVLDPAVKSPARVVAPHGWKQRIAHSDRPAKSADRPTRYAGQKSSQKLVNSSLGSYNISTLETLDPDFEVVATEHSAHPIATLSKHRVTEQYQRRPRDKTRADRYVPKRRPHPKHRSTKAEVHRKERKLDWSRRKGNGSKATGLVQGIQLRQGTRKARLTLQPNTNAGIFVHGRASVQVPAKGNGLPDLVFNELDFLQKPQDRLDSADETAVTGKKERNGRQDEHISSFFQAKVAEGQLDGPSGKSKTISRTLDLQMSDQCSCEEREFDARQDAGQKHRRASTEVPANTNAHSIETPLYSRGSHLRAHERKLCEHGSADCSWSEAGQPETRKTHLTSPKIAHMGSSLRYIGAVPNLTKTYAAHTGANDHHSKRCATLPMLGQSVPSTESQNEDAVNYHTSDILTVRESTNASVDGECEKTQGFLHQAHGYVDLSSAQNILANAHCALQQYTNNFESVQADHRTHLGNLPGIGNT
ncbi:hypothetical protein K431DRAFT_27706 [Polychaeton citri CBS 116435]|uniref:Uncharacterized protein n=1 Tax=Polychaeton citri CBS 116435 TaxID=1314669 RepID=A0A9P4QCQ2_9PEZI|nr:hypothetical protein K431DRAFT_27706 [Polychaeton citri CBS 116435]